MGDMSKEPSMEEILSSIKRIIAEEGDEASRGISARTSRRVRPVEEVSQPLDIEENSVEEESPSSYAQTDEILELTDPLDLEEVAADPAPSQPTPAPVSSPVPEAPVMAKPAPKPVALAAAPVAESAQADTMLSVESEVATRHSLSALSAMVVKPQDGGDNTLESLVRELLRPMMKEWLDANLPDLVEAMVAKEIARITGRDL